MTIFFPPSPLDPLPQSAPLWLERPGRPRLAVRPRAGGGPALVFLPGYASDMQGGKALALEAWAAAQGRAMLRFDYAGCGESEGSFPDQTLADWRDDALAVIDAHAPAGPLLLIGSSMGGWLALLVAEALGARVAGLVGIAAAPDFTEWGFSETEKSILFTNERLERVSADDGAIMRTSFAFWQSGQQLRLLDREIAIDSPVRLLQGQQDAAVPWTIAPRLAGQIRSDDVQVSLIKDGDHRLSRPQDLALLLRAVADLGRERSGPK